MERVAGKSSGCGTYPSPARVQLPVLLDKLPTLVLIVLNGARKVPVLLSERVVNLGYYTLFDYARENVSWRVLTSQSDQVVAHHAPLARTRVNQPSRGALFSMES